MYQPEPSSISYPALVGDIEKGLIKIPQFQRDFVWTRQKAAMLMDSVIKGYPIGTFILWKTKESLRSVRDLGNAKLPETPHGEFVQYVLDGQQRITSIFATLQGFKIQREGGTIDDFGQIFVDLSTADDGEIVIVDASGKDPKAIVKVVDLVSAPLSFLFAYPECFHARLDELRTRIKNYAFSTVLLREAPIGVATEVFTRINVSGNPLTVFQVMVAKTFDSTRDFDLAERYDKLIEELKDVDYETISPEVVLQTVSAILVRDCDKKAILALDKQEFIDVWPSAVDAIQSAVDYFRNYYRIPVSALLPYRALLIPFAYFFFFHRDKPTDGKEVLLQDFFWRTSLAGRYSSSLESKLAQDLKRINDICAGGQPNYDYSIDISPEFIKKNGEFSASRSYIKAILCIFAYHQPKSFVDDSIVRMSNDWLKQVNSKNYHHFFPRAYLQKRVDPRDPRINHIANITIVDDYLNKRKIRDRAPSDYMSDFRKKNKKLNETMGTHLIDLDAFGVWSDDFDRFFDQRCKAIGAEIASRIVPRPGERNEQLIELHDVEEVGV